MDLAPWQPIADDGDRPLYAHDYAELLGQCEDGLARRRKAYPEWVRTGQLADEEAARDIAAWELLVAEWRWILSGEGAPPPRHTLSQRIDAVNLALERVSVEVRRRGGHEVLRQSHLLQALRWHLVTHRFGAPAVHFFAAATHAARAEAAREHPEQRKPAMEAA